jgi:beta-lactamase regulating signal transducer with metallopeptidase domain/thiol-disulfide isomerase/thioredoxin/protocatechuate 3,4-dioxygenase beta subunit
MAILQDWYPGDPALEFLAVIALGVTAFSGIAWVVSRGLARRPAVRHLVLFWAILGSLGMPGLAALFHASELRFVSIPILKERLATSRPEQTAVQGMATAPFLSPIDFTGKPARSTATGEAPGRASFPARPESTPSDAAVPANSASSRPGRNEPWPGEPLTYREIGTLLLLIWSLGGAFFLFRFARCCLLVSRLLRASAPSANPSLERLMAEAGVALGLRRTPELRVSRSVPTPLAAGFTRLAVILPERLIGAVTNDELRDVLLHELAHVVRRDPLAVLVQELARAFYWPIVTVHGALAELARAREELCDNHVLQARDAVSYGQTLLHLAELALKGRPIESAVGILHWRGELERRIAGFLDQGRSTMTRTSGWLAGLVALVFLGAGMLTAATRLIAATEQPREILATLPAAENAPQPQPDEPTKRTMRVLVLGPDGRPMPEVRIHRSVWTRKPGARGNLDVVTDDEGETLLEVPEGIYIWRLWARADGYVPIFAHWEEAENPERNLPAEFTFKLDRGTTIGGVVRDPDGKPIRGVSVEVMLSRRPESSGDGHTGPDMWLAEGGAAARTDAEGRWTLNNIPPGLNLDLKLRLNHADYISDAEWGTLQKEQGITLKDLRTRKATITMRGGLVATGTVTDPEGKPVAGAVVVRGNDPYLEWGSQEVRTDPQGHYWFPPLPAGSINVTVIARGWMPALRNVEIKPGMPPFDFRLEPGKELKLRFVDAAGKPVPGVYVAIDGWRTGKSLYNHRHPNVLDTGIPDRADDQGLYVWSWAPADAVRYRFYKEGMAEQQARLTADGREQTVSLPQVLKLSGRVTDAATGRPIPRFVAMPVIEDMPGRLFTERNHVKNCTNGSFSIQSDRLGYRSDGPDAACRVRIEAEGYRSAISEAVKPGAPHAPLDIRLEPAPPLTGRILDTQGKPVKGARVHLATRSQVVMNPEDDQGMFNQQVLTDQEGAFAFPAQCERYALVVIHNLGYAEVAGTPDSQPGDLALQPWARIQGRLLQAGKPVPGVWISFNPMRVLGGDRPHVQQDLSVQTDRDGRFMFTRVPPIKGSVLAQLSVFQPSPLTSSQSIPLDLQPGETAEVELGGKGTVVRGRVVLSGDAASTIDLSKSLNWLLRRAPGIEPTAELAAAGFTASGGWNNVWTASQVGYAFLRTLNTHFVVLDKNGRFAIHGVPAGDYDLALRLYEPPGQGCLVNPVGSRVVRINVSEEAARKESLDVGEIAVNVTVGPRVGDPAPDFLLTPLLDGDALRLSSLRGRYVLLDFWATWCAPCVSELPALAKLHETYKGNDHFTLLGVNLDEDPVAAKSMLNRTTGAWTQNRAGNIASERDDVLRSYAISSVPCYILIGPDGKLLHRGENLEEVAKVMERVLR